MVRGCGPQPLVRFLRFTLGDSVFSSSRKSVIRLVWLLNESPGICLALLLQYVPPHPAPHMGDRVKLRSLCLHTCNFTQEGEAGLGYSAWLLPWNRQSKKQNQNPPKTKKQRFHLPKTLLNSVVTFMVKTKGVIELVPFLPKWPVLVTDLCLSSVWSCDCDLRCLSSLLLFGLEWLCCLGNWFPGSVLAEQSLC